MSLKKQMGLTLIELMIVVAIIGILAAIAYPSYQSSVMKSRRADAHTTLFAIQLELEKMRGNCAQYASASITDLDDTSITLTDSCSNSGASSVQGKYYKYSVASTSGEESYNYTITATPGGAQASDSDCPTITLTRDGTQGPSSDCW